ncbi:hypothetical protein C1646_753307 [Rhizophagus diaphanus]|nr:hypothetical protein C1646_753307 [Rhizophagus diaphanus] [Rhizophagus sp. MUCL 43196]
MSDTDAVNFVKEDGINVNDIFYMSRKERLISEEIYFCNFENVGLISTRNNKKYKHTQRKCREWYTLNNLIVTHNLVVTSQAIFIQSYSQLSQVTPKEGGEEAEEVDICQVSNLISGETVEMIAQRIMWDSLGEKEVKAIAKALTSPNPVTATSRLSRLRKELWKLNTPEKIISATYDERTTCASNKIQKERRVLRENEGIDFSDHFSLESVKKRLNLYDVPKIPTVQVLADVMIMLCIHPAEIKDLSLERDEERVKLLLTWIQDAISSGQLRDPGVPGVKWFNTFLKKDRFLSETGKPLLPSYLRKLGAVFAVILNGAKNLSEAITIASEAFHHSPDNYTSPAQNYTIVNYQKKGQPYDQATQAGSYQAYRENNQLLGTDKQNAKVYITLSDKNRVLKKQLEEYYSQYNTLERRVKRLEKDVKDLDECVDRKTVVDLIHEIVPSLIGKKGKDSYYLSESSEDSDLVEIIEVREKKAVPHKQRRRARLKKVKTL